MTILRAGTFPHYLYHKLKADKAGNWDKVFDDETLRRFCERMEEEVVTYDPFWSRRPEEEGGGDSLDEAMLVIAEALMETVGSDLEDRKEWLQAVERICEQARAEMGMPDRKVLNP
jgi:hypothetical protein